MGKFSRVGGIVLVVCGLLLFLIGNWGKKNSSGTDYVMIASNGEETVVVDSGTTGGSAEGRKLGDSFKTIGIIVMIGGGIMFVISLKNRDDEDVYM